MKIPVLDGIIDRRILINFTVDPKIVQKIIPAPFKVKMYKGKAIIGICLIRLKKVKPKFLPNIVTLSSENGAHRIAVEWMEDGVLKEGVYVPRRDTSSYFNSLVGGRLFPGKHYHAKFTVQEENHNYAISFKSSDDTTISIDATKATQFSENSIFESLENASQFFEAGSVGYSPKGNQYQGLQLKTFNWFMQPLLVHQVQSSFFENETIFPKGSVQFDNALLMTKIKHEWHGVANKKG
jgi:Uncharacterized conserved protein (COG2071)